MSHEDPRTEASGQEPRGVRVEVRDGRATLTLDAPPLNIFGFGLISAMRDALREVRRREARVAVLRSGVSGVFSSGVDVKIHAPDTAPKMLRDFHRVIRRIVDADT